MRLAVSFWAPGSGLCGRSYHRSPHDAVSEREKFNSSNIHRSSRPGACTNLRAAPPERLQQLANSLTPSDLVSCGQKWLARLTPFFTARERQESGCPTSAVLLASSVPRDNLIFRRRAALDNLGERLLDANRTIGQPNKITTIFGRRISKHYRGKLQTEIEDMDLPNPVIRSHYAAHRDSQQQRQRLRREQIGGEFCSVSAMPFRRSTTTT